MARDFFDKPVSGFTPISGTIVSDVQLALNAATNGNIDTDGLYGRNTGDALAAYQTANHLTASGNVTDETWSALMRTDAPPIFERCLQVTASFEGTGFTLVVGNFDGAGITWGIIGFTLLGGELGTVLKTVNDSDPHLITQAFGRDADQIMEITGAGTSVAKKTQWADSISRGSSKYNVAEPWKTYFSDLGKFREVQRVQVARARDIYWAIAKNNAKQLGLGEELDYLLMYDIAVQNGGMGSKGRLQKAQAAIQDQRPRTAQAKRKIIASVVADTISSRYKQDVFDRKTSIAVGKGTVHGGKYDLSAWGFLDGESPASV